MKPYGRWFQFDVLSADYKKPTALRFGLDGAKGWSMKVPMFEDEVMEDEGTYVNDPMLGLGVAPVTTVPGSREVSGVVMEGRQEGNTLNAATPLPDLNDIAISEETSRASRAIVHFQTQLPLQEMNGAMLFGVDLNVVPPSDAVSLAYSGLDDSGSGCEGIGMNDGVFSRHRVNEIVEWVPQMGGLVQVSSCGQYVEGSGSRSVEVLGGISRQLRKLT